MEKRFKKIFSALENILSERELLKFPSFNNIREIRITVNFPVEVITDERRFYINNRKISISEINEIFSSFCEYSVHAFKNEICEGFITSEGGIRIGICGTAIYSDGKICNIKNISTLNIRIPHEIKGTSENIIKFIENGGILIIGPPCSGKTTILRDFSRKASEKYLVTIVDERMEISGTTEGIPSFDVGNSSVLNGFIKSDGIKTAVRSMAPEIIVCDEFGDENDINSALFAMKSGVKIVASIHSSDKNDFLTKPFVKKILEKKIFETFIFLNKKHKITEILKAEELYS
ncbi:MAG: Flp pilus assembly complex ATPase component TadA [Oscillospiraceae bacterium]|nr:Flp pilus assembly complex ATPase component TadA [Oscillospiraceae bacterium]